MRKLLLSLCAFLAATALFANDAQQSGVVVLEVFADHFELDGTAYQSVTDLVAALGALKGKNVVALQEHDYEDATLQQATAARMREANDATRAAGFRGTRKIGFVTNELRVKPTTETWSCLSTRASPVRSSN